MAQRPRLIVGNWKMHKTVPEARHFVERLAEFLSTAPPANNIEIVLAPPFTALHAVASALATRGLFPKTPPVSLAAQDVHWEDQGACTGEVSPHMLKDAGCRYVIVGHSERRRDFGETDATVRKKVAAILRHGLRPILCIGESWEQRSNGRTEQVLSGQLTEALSGVDKDRAADIVIAYEPVWAIGSGHPATAEQARDAHRHIRTKATALWGQDAGERPRILYGGSVTSDNLGELVALREVDGALVGGACLDPVQFARILSIAGLQP
jgi:triosephosphate isomerase